MPLFAPYSEPAGTMKVFVEGKCPEGCLLCDGSDVSRKTYPNLFQAIGTEFGPGDLSTTFTLPNIASICSKTVWMIKY